ncbi:hypothetical protein FISHEDRAFT_75672 [Fistulina hepatica ATCC 64428]|uniref:Uncharacterized protein n=1 Tax=Fistulina hepatica ATCC 64428 TaxID=1128425 RepID=A0A0D7A7S7_9AGAR|nr:hypothetical protein FISHEDRAFT_75672 [Fistulina hepatica ATCC 64428]
MPTALEILEKKITKITSQIESIDKGGGKKAETGAGGVTGCGALKEVKEGGEGELAGEVDVAGEGKKKVPVEEAPPNDEYEESSEELGSGSGELGESGEDEEDKGEVQGPLEDPELVRRMKELGESFKRVWEEMGNKLKGMEKDVKMVRTEVAKLFGASGDWEVGLGEAQSRICGAPKVPDVGSRLPKRNWVVHGVKHGRGSVGCPHHGEGVGGDGSRG